MKQLHFASSPAASGGLLPGFVRLVVAAAAMVFALGTAVLLMAVALLFMGIGLVRRAAFALAGRPATPWVLPLLLRLLQRTRWAGFVPPQAAPGDVAAKRPAPAGDVTDVAVKAWRP